MLDKYLMKYLMDYEDKKFQNVSLSFKELTNKNIDDVKISNRLADSPCVVVRSKYGWSSNMERTMQSQTLSDANKQSYMPGKRTLEINPRHPIIKELQERVVKDPDNESAKQTAQLMYQNALMENRFILNDPKDFASRIYSSVKNSLNISFDAIVEEKDDVEETETESIVKETQSPSKTEEEPE